MRELLKARLICGYEETCITSYRKKTVILLPNYYLYQEVSPVILVIVWLLITIFIDTIFMPTNQIDGLTCRWIVDGSGYT